MKLSYKITPVTFRQAKNFVKDHHRHNAPPQGHKFSIGLLREGKLVGVVMVGRPIARRQDDGSTAEITRCCVLEGNPNANSALYAAAWRAARSMGYDRIIWCEEATELLSEDVDILDDRLRGNLEDLNPNLFYQITMTFNPVSATHWIKARYFDKADPDVLTHHSTYKTNRFIDPAYFRRMERRKEEDPEGYRVYGLGEWGELGGLILTNFEVHDFPTDRDFFDGFYYGQDFGFNHADAILGIGWKDGEIYVTSEVYVFEKDTEEIIALARQKRIDPRVEMFCDSAEPDRIRTWQKAGFRAYPVKKEPGSVKAQIDFLKGRKIHIHPSCVNTLKEVQQWKWKKDPTTGLYIDEPVEFMDDAMAALRYGVERPRRGSSIEVLK